jgi:hypothetical protein
LPGQERANDGHDDIDQQVRAVMHDLGREPTDDCGNNEVDEKVRFYLLCECLSCAAYRAFFDPDPGSFRGEGLLRRCDHLAGVGLLG